VASIAAQYPLLASLAESYPGVLTLLGISDNAWFPITPLPSTSWSIRRGHWPRRTGNAAPYGHPQHVVTRLLIEDGQLVEAALAARWTLASSCDQL